MGFASEKELFNAILRSKLFFRICDDENSILQFEEEPKGLFGIPDLVVARVKLTPRSNLYRCFAFEFKLSKWKKALSQAFKYKAFAHKAYVVLDEKHINPALKNIALFKQAKIGLLSINAQMEICVHYDPPFKKPYSLQLEKAFKVYLKNKLPFNRKQ